RIRQINGHPNPDDVDEQQLKDDEQARRAAREEAATLQKRQATAEVEKKQADAALASARASQVNVQAIVEALSAAGLMIVANPQQVHLADAIAKDGRPKPEEQQQPQQPAALPA
ncbi:MAG TPA: hypothetical protein VGE69_17200, partial [Pseudomonadales bacterium]